MNESRVLTDKSQTVLATIYKENVKSMIKRKKKGLIVRKNGESSKIKDKSNTVRTGGRGSYDRHDWDSVDEKKWRKLSVIECERLQTVPDNYTNHVSNTQRYKMLGNGWTVDVICHILSHIPEEERK